MTPRKIRSISLGPYFVLSPCVLSLFLNLILQKRWPLITAFVGVGLAGWAAFLLVATNQEKLSSSVVRQIIRTAKDNKELREMLGKAIRPQPEWWLNGNPWIEGSVSTRVPFILILCWKEEIC
jgi:Cytochrome oxidase complex assembly protein 1